MSKQADYDSMCPTVAKHKLGTWLQSVRTWIVDMLARQAENKVVIDELIDDHATIKAELDELHSWAEALAAKLNADTGVADTDYDDTIANDAPETLSASKPTALSAPTPGTLA